MKFSSEVPCNIKKGTNIIDYLCTRFTYLSRQEWEENVTNGKISIDAKTPDLNYIVEPGTTLVYDPGEFEEPPANLEYKIIYEDEWFIGINKPGNLLVHRAGKSFRNNLMYQLRYNNDPPFPDAHPTHRLDRDTSGVVLVAKNVQERAAVGTSFAEQKINKQYSAIVHGIPDGSQRIIDAPIANAQCPSISYKFHVDQLGKPAVTELLNITPIGNNFSLLKLKPHTGRTHQIRIHCAFIGHPIVGDKLYGLSEAEYIQWRDQPTLNTPVLFYRHALHCAAMEFVHPIDNRLVRIEAPLPQDMLDLIDSLQ
jgi:RluA family pseudouridine synthase